MVADRYLVSAPRCLEPCLEPHASNHECNFQVAWAINPHMQIGSTAQARAVEQHETFVRALIESGARVHALPFVHGAFDSVFSKDNAVVLERTGGRVEALLARPRHDERAREQLARARALRALGFDVEQAATEHLEGGDIVVLPNADGCFLGYGFRSSPKAADDLEKFFNRAVTCLELCDPRLYHLDMALSVLDDGTAIVCEDALTPASRQALARDPRITSIVRVPLQDALTFSINIVQVRRTIVTGGRSPTLERELARRGYSVKHVGLDEFQRAGGSAACLVARVHRQKRAWLRIETSAA